MIMLGVDCVLREGVSDEQGSAPGPLLAEDSHPEPSCKARCGEQHVSISNSASEQVHKTLSTYRWPPTTAAHQACHSIVVSARPARRDTLVRYRVHSLTIPRSDLLTTRYLRKREEQAHVSLYSKAETWCCETGLTHSA